MKSLMRVVCPMTFLKTNFKYLACKSSGLSDDKFIKLFFAHSAVEVERLVFE